MAFIVNFILAMTSLAVVLAQRPFFAGSRPIGYPERVKPAADQLGNRFGDGDTSTTTQRLPLEANGDRDLVDRLSKLPVDQQPFWLLNWKALENHRKNPQTYPQRPSPFSESAMPVQSSGRENSKPSDSNLQNRFAGPSNVNDGVVNPNDFHSGKVNQTLVSLISSTGGAELVLDENNRSPVNANVVESTSSHAPIPNKGPVDVNLSSSSVNHHTSGSHHHHRPSATAKPSTSKGTIAPGLTHISSDFYDDLDIDLHNGHLNSDIKKKQKLQQQHAQSNIPLSIYDLYF